MRSIGLPFGFPAGEARHHEQLPRVGRRGRSVRCGGWMVMASRGDGFEDASVALENGACV